MKHQGTTPARVVDRRHGAGARCRPPNTCASILLVDGDPALAEILQRGLSARGYRVRRAASVADGEAAAEEGGADFVVVDVTLPGAPGLVLRASRRPRTEAPIVIGTGPRRPEDAVRGFKLGADDFVAKPFSPDELEARMQAIRRRRAPGAAFWMPDDAPIVVGPLAIDRAGCTARLGGAPLRLTPTEYRLLCILADPPNRVRSVEELAERVWGAYDSGLGRSIGTHLRRLRAKLKAGVVAAPSLTAVRALGYKLAWEPATDVAS